MKRLGFLLLFLCATALAQTDYKIRGYELSIVPDFAAKTVRVNTIIRIANFGGVSGFEFGLGNEYKIESLTVNGAPTDYAAKDGILSIKLVKPEHDVLITVATTGSPGKSHDEDAMVIDDDSLYLLWSDRFYPIDYDHWAPVRTTITLPRDYKVVAPGHMMRSEEVEGGLRVLFETTQPTVCYSVFADRRWLRNERVVNGLKIITLLHPEQEKYAEKIFAGSGDVLKFFTELHGYYPGEQFSFVTVAGMRGRRALNGYIAYGPPFLDREMERTGYDAHETSLLWWGYTTRGTGPGSFQWTEGFGDYVEFLYSQYRKTALPSQFERFRNEYLATPTEQEPLFTELRGNTPQKFVHGKYPWLMAVVHDSIGDAAFRKGLQTLFVEHRNATFTIDDLIASFERASGTKLDWWRKQWLERRGVPQLSMANKANSQRKTKGMSFRVDGTLEQHGATYRFPVEIGIRTATGVEYVRFTVSNQQTPFVWTGRAEPLEVILDPKNKLLYKLYSAGSAGQ
jgi:aminopeptidase N